MRKSSRQMGRNVLVVQEHLPHYRVDFFDGIRNTLAGRGVGVDLVHRKGQSRQFLAGELDWGIEVPATKIGGFVWHRDTVRRAMGYDLVICGHELKYLSGAMIQLLSACGGPKFAYWGHGPGVGRGPGWDVKNRIKRMQAVRADWWFAYTRSGMERLRGCGFSSERVTIVGNAIDTRKLMAARRALRAEEVETVRREHGISGIQVGIYTGGLYKLKRIEFLIRSAEAIREAIPEFELIVIGDGPDRPLIEDAAGRHGWIHYVGAKSDLEKIPFWALSSVVLMPGGVGLVILD